MSTPFRFEWMDGQGHPWLTTLTDGLKRPMVRFAMAIGQGNPELN